MLVSIGREKQMWCKF